MSPKFKRILLVVNGSSNSDREAIRAAVQLANLNSATLTIVSVVDVWSKVLGVAEDLLQQNIKLNKLLADDLQNRLKHSLKLIKDPKKVKYKILEGTAFIQLIKLVIKGRHDILITSAECNKKVGAGIFSGSDLHLLRKCPCPVWIIKPSRTHTYKNLMVAVDLDPDDSVKKKLNKKLMESAMLFAKKYKAKLTVYYAWSLPGEKTLRNSPFLQISKREIDSKVKNEKQKSEQRLEDFVAQYEGNGIKISSHLQKGNPADLMPSFIRKHKINLVVMGTVCRVGVPGFFIGNTAEEVLQKIRCSVLTIKPNGFKSPVC